MIHDIDIIVKDTHYTGYTSSTTERKQTIANAIDIIDACTDAVRNVSLIYTYDISCGYYVDQLIYSGNMACMTCRSYTDPLDYHKIVANAANAEVQTGKNETIMKNLQNVIYESGYINA